MRYCILEHQHKAKAYIDALRTYKYIAHRRTKLAKFLLIDFEWSGVFAGNGKYLRKQILEAEAARIPVFLYPHSVRPNIPFDLVDEQYEGTRALFTIAEGHKEVLKRIGYPCPVEVTGWTYTDIKPFKPREVANRKIRVLFAPIHPVGKGYLPDDERELNAKTYQLLLGLINDIDLTVRHIQPLEHNGLWADQRVNYVTGSFNGSTEDMDKADVVIAAFTYSHMAVALGHPLIMLGEGIRSHNSPRKDGKLIYAKNWEKYRDYMRYPFEIESCTTSADLMDLILAATWKNDAVDDWKRRFIGKPFDAQRFVKTLESYL